MSERQDFGLRAMGWDLQCTDTLFAIEKRSVGLGVRSGLDPAALRPWG